MPTKRKARLMMEQRLFSLLLNRGTFKLSSFWLSQVLTKTKAGQIHVGVTPLFIAAQMGHLEVVRFLVKSGADKDQGMFDDGATHSC